MTSIECTFTLPTGEPLALASVEIQLSQSAYLSTITGITLPRPIYATTDEFGKVIVELQPSDEPYFVMVTDTLSEAVIAYKFLVPIAGAGVVLRLQDLIDETVTTCGGTDPGTGTTGSLGLTSLVVVNGTNVGAAVDGTVFPIGMTFQEFVEAVSIKANAVAYLAPTLSLAATPSPTNTEVGTVINIALLATFAQRDGGASNSVAMKKDGVTISALLSFTDSNITITETSTGYQCQVSYDQGAIKNNNLGVADPTGRIAAGTVNSNTLTFVGKRKAFYGTPTEAPTTSSLVRGLAASGFESGNNSGVDASGVALIGTPVPSFTISIPAGATKVCFAYPASSRIVASVLYQELFNSEVKGNFVQTTVSVEGAAGYAATSYRVYTYTPAEAFSSAVNYKVFI